ncbi:MAG: hypothetical protein U1G08_17915 [Verrucomicrobiota bacterium]
MNSTRLILAVALLAFPAIAQNKMSSVATVADLVAQPPETFATSPTLGGASFLAYVETSGDTTAGSGKKTWWFSAAATFPTNTAANNGPIAYPYGSAAGRWLFVPEVNATANGALVSSLGVPGQIPVATGTNAFGPSGFSTNLIRNLARVVLTVDDLVATDPTNLLSLPGGTAAWVQTSGDSVANSGIRFWSWNSSGTAGTNTAAKGGPIAYPYGSGTGRWEQLQLAGMLAPTDRVLVINPVFPDDASGTMNAFDPSTNIQTSWDTASALYDPYLGKVRVLHPAGQFTGGELVFRKNVRYWSDYVFHYRKRYQPSGTSQRSVVTTARLGGATLDTTDGSFLNWNASGGTNNYFAAADNWYGLSSGVEIGGGGKFIFDQNQKDVSQPLVRLLEVDDFQVLSPGVLEAWLSVSTNASPVSNYGIQLCGRNVIWYCPIIRGGTVVAQDGLHIGWGRNIQIIGGFSASGDDSLAFQAEAGGGSTLPPDEPLENVYVSNWIADPLRARACVTHAGVNWISAPYTNRTPELRNIVVNGISGYVSKQRQSALQMGNFQDGSGIWSYTITSPGSGYTDGYYSLPLSATGGGSGANVMVKVVGGSIVRAVPCKGGTGTGYLVNHAGTYSAGATNIALDTGTGTILSGDKVKFTGDSTTYTVWSGLSGGSINLASGLGQTLADNVAVTVTSSSSSWKTGTGYTADQTAFVDAVIPGGTGGVVTGLTFGAPNDRIVGCAIRNFNLISGGQTHDGTEPYAIRVHGATDCEIGPGYIVLIENTNSPAHRPFFIEGAKDVTIRGVTIVSSTTNGIQNGGAINVTKPRSVVDGLRIVDSKWGPIRNSGNGLMKVNGTTVGKISFERDRLIIGSGMSGFYMPDYESSKTCYTTNLNIESCEFLPVDGATSTKAVNFVANAGGTGLVCGMFRFVENDVTGISNFNTAAQLQAATTAYEIRDNRGGYRTETWTTVTQNSGTTSFTVTDGTYTGLPDNTTASLPSITVTPYGNVGAWWVTANSTTSITVNTASAPGSAVTWGVHIRHPRKPFSAY